MVFNPLKVARYSSRMQKPSAAGLDHRRDKTGTWGFPRAGELTHYNRG